MQTDLIKLAEKFRDGSRYLDDDETVLLASAVETIALEKEAGRLEGVDSEKEVVMLGAAVADAILRRSS